jgi:metal transporter CNNM
MGLTSQDLQTLRVKKSMNPDDYTDDDRRELVRKEKRWASKLEPLVRRHHLTLVSLLLMNAGVNEALPIFLDNIVPEWMAVVLSVTFVLIFGEIIPSAVLTGPSSLCISAGLSWFVWLIIVVLFPLSWPISKLLDVCMGEEHGMRTTFDPIEMRVRLDLEAADHEEEVRHQHDDADSHLGSGVLVKKKSLQSIIHRSVSEQHDSLLDYHKIMRGAVNLATATAACINIKHRCITKVSSLSMDTVLDADRLAQMLHQGFSRCVAYVVVAAGVCLRAQSTTEPKNVVSTCLLVVDRRGKVPGV